MTFEDLNLIKPIFQAISKEGYKNPTPIQKQAIPLLLEDKDLIGIAQTGTGKSAAFILPLLQKLELENKHPMKNRPRALILAPTRELAAQIGKSCETYGAFTKLHFTVIFGGVNQGPQVKALSRGVDVLVATPGRLIDLINQGYIRLNDVKTFILDEADRMLDMGFVEDIRRLLPLLSNDRQTLMFSATMSKEVNKLANDFLKDPFKIDLSPKEPVISKIKQELFFVEKTEKLPLLLYLMKKNLYHVLIFTRTKIAADKVARALSKNKIFAEAIHSDKTQAKRTRALEKFQKGKIVLVATDIAARGIDVDGISHVINFDLPNDPENYVHRIGRTGRAGADGAAFSFCDETEKDYLRAIEKITNQTLTFVDHPFHSELAQKSKQRAPKRGGRGSGSRSRRSSDGKSRGSFNRGNLRKGSSSDGRSRGSFSRSFSRVGRGSFSRGSSSRDDGHGFKKHNSDSSSSGDRRGSSSVKKDFSSRNKRSSSGKKKSFSKRN